MLKLIFLPHVTKHYNAKQVRFFFHSSRFLNEIRHYFCLVLANITIPKQVTFIFYFSVSLWQYDRSSSDVSHVMSLSGHVSGVKAVDCDAVRVVTASRDRTLRLWSVKTANEINEIKLAGKSHCKIEPSNRTSIILWYLKMQHVQSQKQEILRSTMRNWIKPI
jgi:hypothetical protein